MLALLSSVSMALAQAAAPATSVGGGIDKIGIGLGMAGVAIGAGIVVLGGGRGIGHIGGSAVEAIARQPEAKGSIGTNMIIAAALIEGFTFFALIITLLAMNAIGK